VPVPSDLFLSPDLTEDAAREYLRTFGFRDPGTADQHLQGLAEDMVLREILGRIAKDLLPALADSPDPDAAVIGLSRYVMARTGRGMFLDYLGEDPRAMHVLTFVMGASPFLSEILIRNPEYFHWLVSQIERSAPDRQDLEDEVQAMLAGVDNADEALDALKRWKRRETLRIATRDLLKLETVPSATAQISDLAEVAVDTALAVVTRQLTAADGRAAAPGAFTVIGMGKLGGGELNYSSDIDLIYVFDTPDESEADGGSARDFFHRLAKRLTSALSEHTGESYLYRVDLRLRPGGARGPIVYSLDEYDEYYNSWGETFERFALLKARPIAGDMRLGRRFVDRMQPFVYRRYLDRAALEELSRYKARSDRALGSRADDRNVKAGRGGIREIELFTQVFQLTYGGRDFSLRQPNTLAGLDALVNAGLISDRNRRELRHAYEFLRAVEHRLQLVHEIQTHRISEAEAELEISARRLGLGSSQDLAKQLTAYQDRVHAIYTGLFEHRAETADTETRQVFRILNGELTDQEGIKYLSAAGFRDPSAVLAAIGALNSSASASQAGSSARNVLANLLASLLPRVVACARPEQVLHRLEQLASATGSAVLFYRSLLEHESFRDVVVLMLDAGDLTAQRLIRYPELLDSLPLPSEDVETFGRRVTSALDHRGELATEERMSQVRRLKQLEEFKITREWLVGGELDTLQEKLSLLAEACVEHAARWHAAALGSRESWAVVALGKLGGVELAIHSDLDLVVLYDGDPDDARLFERYQSFVEAMQRFLEQPTGDGIVYDVDTRLRPEGRKGALAIPVSMFQRYLTTRAEIWERLAWTRLRRVAAPAILGDRIEAMVEKFVYGPWDPAIPGYMRDVRTRVEREIGAERDERLHFKAGKGGLVDIDFALQMIQIREGLQRPEFRVAGTRRLLAAWPATRFLSASEAVRLRDAHGFLRTLEMFARMDQDASTNWVPSDPAALAPLEVRMGLPVASGESLLERYRSVTSEVRSIYLEVLSRLEE
jgi:[glutamine synthetase] adenylyltransferase / [glutamine synthetase]-adenylyl-L-tyrosine phosphorylase